MTFLVSYTSAQGIVTKGLRGGLNLANISGKDAEDTSFRIGFALGGFVTYSLNEQLALQPEIYFTSKGFKSEAQESNSFSGYRYSISSESSVSLNYLEIPVLGVFSVNQNIRLLAGPYLDIYLNGMAKEKYKTLTEYYNSYENRWIIEDEKSDSNSEDIESDDVNTPGLGLIFGAEFIAGQISISARYSIGLSNIPDDSDFEFKHKVIQFYVGFYIP
jgi:hypothetical protein